MAIEQFLFTRNIGSQSFSVFVPCKDWDDARDIAAKTGMTVEGNKVSTIPCVPIRQFMTFLSSLMDNGEESDFRIKWKPIAEEQIEAFLCCGWDEKPHEQ